VTECERIRAQAAGLAALPPGDPERSSARAHARGCPGCARALREAERLQELLGSQPPEPVPAAVLERASRAIVADLRREGRRRAIASAGAAAAILLLLATLGRHRSSAPGDWALAAALGALAALLAASAGRWARAVIPAAAAAALAAAALGGEGGLLHAGLGLHCAGAELAGAGLVVGAMWLALRGGSTSPARSTMAAAAAAGALAADAALPLTCSGRGAMGHDLVFHLGGVLLAAALGSLLRRRPAAAA
jgi:hypothetical protein